MTVSTARRKDHIRITLKKMIEAIGDDERFVIFFDPSDSRFTAILQTTWRDMLDADLIKDHGGVFELTAFGWLVGLRESRRLESDEVRDRARKIVQALKARVKGRHGVHDELMDARELAAETALPVGWVYNALDSKLLQKVFPKDRMNVRFEDPLIWIPPAFGTDPIDIN